MQGARRADPTSRRRRRGRRGGGGGRAEAYCEAAGPAMLGKGGDEEEEEMAGGGGGGPGSLRVVRVKRELLAACMTCPLCHGLFRDATTISECLHTFCRKCIYEKLTDEEVDSCPICNIDLGCSPVEKLRPDHNLQDVRAKIFPFKRRKVKAPEIVPSISLPTRRKERSLSSLVISTPRVATQSGLTGRRTKAVGRKSYALRGLNIDDSIKKENHAENHPESSSSAETLNKMAHSKRQNSSSVEPSDRTSNKDAENGAELSSDKTEMWKPLNCLVEAANRTKSFKFSGQGSVAKSGQTVGPERDIHAHKTKAGEHQHKAKIQHDKNNSEHAAPVLTNSRRMHGISRKRASGSRELGTSTQALLDAASVKRERRISPIWFSLIAAPEQEEDTRLPQISTCYLRMKDGSLPVSFIQKYVAMKLDLASESEVEITCRGQPVVSTLALHKLVELWLQTGSSQKAQASVGTSAKDFVMVLAYARKAPSA